MSQNPPDLSVVTVVLNDKAGLLKAIESVNQQYGLRIEHIIVDGGSTDGSAQIAHEYSSIAIESRPDGGIYPAMHRGALAASGEFLIFCNAGDALFGKEFLAEAVSQIRRSGAVWGFGPIIEHTQRDTFTWIAADFAATSESIIARKSFVPFPSFIFKQSLYREIGPLSSAYHVAGDFEFICKFALKHTPTIFKHPIALFSSGGISYTKANIAWQEEMRIRIALLDIDSTKRLFELLKYYLRIVKWRIGKILDFVEKISPAKQSWRDLRATPVPIVYSIFLP